jgi:hypothetical protein
MTHPKDKTISNLNISVDFNGWPRWTRITATDRLWVAVLNEEEARDLHYALTRIIAFLEDAKQTDRLNGIVA